MTKGGTKRQAHGGDKRHEAAKAADAALQMFRSIDPVYLAAGAAIVGAVVAMFAPRSAAETRLLAPLGSQVNAFVGTLGASARQVVSTEVAAVPLVGQFAVQQLDRVLDGVDAK